MFQGFFLQDLNRFGNWKFETNHFISLMKLVDKYSELLTIVYQWNEGSCDKVIGLTQQRDWNRMALLQFSRALFVASRAKQIRLKISLGLIENGSFWLLKRTSGSKVTLITNGNLWSFKKFLRDQHFTGRYWAERTILIFIWYRWLSFARETVSSCNLVSHTEVRRRRRGESEKFVCRQKMF